MEAIGGVLGAFGLSASAGLNAYIPLFIVALTAKFTDLIKLGEPWEALTSWWVIGVLIILGVIEFFADKLPAVNHVNDAVQTFIRPAAGAVLFAASTQVITEIHPVISLIAGLLVAGGVHAIKSTAVRPAVSASTATTGNIAVSVIEDVVAFVLSVLSVVLPVVIAALIIVITSFVIWWLWRRANRIKTA